MPKLWNETIESHRRAVREAALDAVDGLVAEHGPASVTMSAVARRTGVGRATLYKYFPDAHALLTAWHERRITDHVGRLVAIRDRPGPAADRLADVLEAYAELSRERHGTELAALLHRGEHIQRAQEHLFGLVRDLLDEGARAGDVRDDVPAGELAGYCLHALTAAGRLDSAAAVHRLVTVTLAGVRPPH
ncbi:TetR/AcrR family transcriptional regulator [Kocuria sp. M1R5S2]|uniref:TetR/AcrR family transcriptional regulator n=1 Tax=Kocuria rhizosphaerae TaxID=3376285 RepID=UPI003796F2C3